MFLKIKVSLAKRVACGSFGLSKTRHNRRLTRSQQQPMSAAAPTADTKEFKLHEKDTGSADVQVALLTERINYLTQHLSVHVKDHSTRRGLLRMVARRRKLLDYLKLTANDRYTKLLKSLSLRR
jgi:small subunit ribosomal protein S15